MMEEKKIDSIYNDNDHLTVADEPIIQRNRTVEKKEYNIKKEYYSVKKEKKTGPITWFKELYGFSQEEDDLKFVHSSYSYANEEPSKFANTLFLLIVGIFGSILIWASFAEIDELARGAGKVIPTDKIQTVQSLDGGIISEIYVKEGEEIKKDTPLMKIDTTRFQASLEESQQEYLSLLALKARLEIESMIDINNKKIRLKFNEKVLNNYSRYDKNERLLYNNRFEGLKSSIKVLETQLNQKEQELKEIYSNIKKLKKSLEFVKQQRTTMSRLVNKGVKSNIDLISIDKEYYQILGDLETAELSISRSEYAISEARNRIDEKINSFRTEASDLLQKTTGQINKFEAKLIGDKDKVEKTAILSPVDGIIKQLNFNTIGGVIQSGVDLLEIVPLSDTLVVEAKIDPKDIAFINPSQKAIVKITAYDFSIYGGLDGKIIEISADSIVDKESKDGKSYYRVLVKTDKNFLERNGERLPIIPGMVASVDIVTGKKTILDFILKPILKVKQNSLHER